MRHHRTQQTSKHKKIKAIDPFYSGPRRDAIFKAERYANKPPPNLSGDQEIPRKLKELMEAKEKQVADAKIHKSGRLAKGIISKKKHPDAPEFKQGKYETLSHFYRRMDKAAQEAIMKAELEVQFDVNFERKGRNKLVVSKTRDPVEEDEPPQSHKLTKTQKRREKLRQKVKERIEYDRDEFDDMKDHVAFGETVQGPPLMKAAPRKAPEVKKTRDKDLHLKRLTLPVVEETIIPRSIFDRTPGITSNVIATARQEELRQEAVAAYRKLKKQRLNSKKTSSLGDDFT